MYIFTSKVIYIYQKVIYIFTTSYLQNGKNSLFKEFYFVHFFLKLENFTITKVKISQMFVMKICHAESTLRAVSH